MDRLVELSQIVAGRQPGRTSPEEISLFCSVGLAATEVVVAHEAFQRWQEGASSF
jgi:ornithine cyclodeaminase